MELTDVHKANGPASTAARAAQDAEIDLGRFVRRLVKERRRIALLMLLALLIAAPFDLLRANMYQAETVLMVVDPVLGGGSSASTVETYRVLISNRTLAEKVLQEFKLNEPPANLTVDKFMTRYFTVNLVQGSNNIVAHVNWYDPTVAVNVLNALARRAVELNRRVNADEVTYVRDQIGEQMLAAEKELHRTQSLWLSARKATPLEMARRDSEVLMVQRGDLARVEVQIEGLRGRIAKAENERAARSPLLTTRRSVLDDPVLAEVARNGSATAPNLRLELKAEQENPVYTRLDEDIATNKARLAELERQHAELSRTAGKATHPTFTKLYESESEQERLRQNYELAKKVYEDAALKYQAARVQAISNIAQLHIVDPAVVPREPMPARRGLYPVVAALAIGLLATMGVLTHEVARAAMETPAS